MQHYAHNKGTLLNETKTNLPNFTANGNKYHRYR
ncbi:hypothetical protein HD_0681 [[Haemophilus] ducreyi 35000HP]|uniref:Uncharacterized protein n=1 Tax=Haemophilus ducreyi (strain 35000HP / ATCC 700724) TaxID=233412 RepID=Q7VN86_HAEDU|nr:hypothetical protein HD_0681 [[Haemophilus] ducreyi 35000HP]